MKKKIDLLKLSSLKDTGATWCERKERERLACPLATISPNQTARHGKLVDILHLASLGFFFDSRMSELLLFFSDQQLGV